VRISIGEVERNFKVIPNLSGVYVFLDVELEPIYVGKAKNLRNRLRSHLKRSSYKSGLIVAQARWIEIYTTSTEAEALLLEARLIKEWRPKHNVQFKDDKSYPYIVITDEEYPALLYVRNPKGKLKYKLGPIHSANLARVLYDWLASEYRLRRCARLRKRLCLYGQLGYCSGVCEMVDTDYSERVAEAIRVLMGDERLVEMWRDKALRKMKEASGCFEYEKASYWRDVAKALNMLEVKYGFSGKIAALFIKREEVKGLGEFVFTMLVFGDRGRVVYSKFEVLPDVEVALSWFFQSLYMYGFPEKIYLPLELLEEYRLKENTDVPLKLLSLEKLDRKLVEWAYKVIENRRQDSQLIESQRKRVEGLEKLSVLFGRWPSIIECYDISTLYGSFNVASRVVMVAGRLEKSRYRRYRLNVVGQDDFASMREVMRRRFKLDKDGVRSARLELPDVVILDGGEPQLRAALSVLRKFFRGDEFVLAGIAKQEEELLVVEDWAKFVVRRIRISLDQEWGRMLILLRDEAHRFAVSYHRSLRERQVLEGVLREIPHIGEKTARKLVSNFASLDEIARADRAELKKLGLNKKMIDSLKKHLAGLVGGICEDK